jgi:hypothetical protein
MRKFKEIITDTKLLTTCALVLAAIFLILLGIYAFLVSEGDHVEESVVERPKGLMLMIEFEDTAGLNNFVYQMNERDIPGLLVVNASYVEQNCDFVKGLQQYNIEIAGIVPEEPFWDLE